MLCCVSLGRRYKSLCWVIQRFPRPPEIGYTSGCVGSFVTSPEISRAPKNVAFRRKALFVEGVSEFVKVAGIMWSYYPRPEDPSCSLTCPENKQEKNNNSEYW